MKFIIIFVIALTSTYLFSQTMNKLYPISNGLNYALVNKNQDTITPFIYDFISKFKEGYAIVKRDNKFGMINFKGVENIPPNYDKIEFLYQGLTIVSIHDSCTILDSLGHSLSNSWFYRIDTPLTDFIRVIKKIDREAIGLLRNTIKHYQLENIIGLSRDSIFFSNYLIGYVSRQKGLFNDLWFSGGEKFENGNAKIAISKHTYFLGKNGEITSRKAEGCDLSLMNIFIPDEFPEYIFGADAFLKNFDENFRFRIDDDKMRYNTKVIASFIIDKTGSLVSLRIEKSLYPKFDAEVLSAIRKTGKWKPAKYNGEPVCWQVHLSIIVNNNTLREEFTTQVGWEL